MSVLTATTAASVQWLSAAPATRAPTRRGTRGSHARRPRRCGEGSDPLRDAINRAQRKRRFGHGCRASMSRRERPDRPLADRPIDMRPSGANVVGRSHSPRAALSGSGGAIHQVAQSPRSDSSLRMTSSATEANATPAATTTESRRLDRSGSAASPRTGGRAEPRNTPRRTQGSADAKSAVNGSRSERRGRSGRRARCSLSWSGVVALDARLCPLLCPPARVLGAVEPKRRGIIIRVSGVRVPPPASRTAWKSGISR
jgi:hypothetical protein